SPSPCCMTLVLRDLVLPLADFTLEVTVEMRARSTALYGPSGAGKTSLLEVIAGLRTPASGTITLDGRTISSLPPRLRRIGYVPQDDALFPHLSVRQNIVYGSRERDDAQVIDMLEIGHVLDRGVKKLSGGERKRVALARALLTRPELLLLDEPLTGVDVALRDRVLEYLVRVHDELAVPTIYVTHQMDEVRAMCDEIVRIERGRIVETRAI
ncbi:MAG TPA: ATP-binding cassette domain-containing protein, partial [Thermoanaerobaculia bacterium]|nr:ATP-binding cassette domain-containing protein [Thermoanaerobaculia bacterium]